MKVKELFEDGSDESRLDDTIFKSLQHELQQLAKDPDKEWPSSLALVHDAYEVCNVERPTPAMRDAWAQYEMLITNAVQYLNKYRPDGHWRVTVATSKVKL